MIALNLSRENLFSQRTPEERAIAHELRQHGAVDAVIADTMNNLAACNEVIGNYAEAKKLYEDSLHLRRLGRWTVA
jgi:hypothetical protein